MDKRHGTCRAIIVVACALLVASRAYATGVPISGFYPLAGISLTSHHDPESPTDATFFQADYQTSYLGTPLGIGGVPHFELALVDTGAATTLITHAADAAFNIQGAGFRGINTFPITGATGETDVVTNDAMAIYASGVGMPNRIPGSTLALETSLMVGQSSVSVGTLQAESALPNVLGIPFTSQYAMYIRNGLPQMFQLGGKTVRTPQIEFKPLGSGGQGVISRFVQLDLDDPNAFLSPPQYVYDFLKAFDPNRTSFTDDPLYPTLRLNASLQAAAAHFINVDVYNDVPFGQPPQAVLNTPFLLDTGADVSVVSVDNAARLGFDVVNDTPDFTVAALGSGGVLEGIPGFYVDHLNIVAAGGNITLNHVPFLVLDFPNPARLGQVVEGLIGMNALSGRDIVVDPKPAACFGCVPRLYVSDPVTSNHGWANATASGSWSTLGNWNEAGTPHVLWITNVRNTSGSAKEAVVSASSTVWEVNVSGVGPATMTVRITSGATLATYSGTNIEAGGRIQLQGGTLDAQYVDVRGGTLTGSGSVLTGSGPIPGQVENHGGIVAPGNGAGTLNITGRFANAVDGTLAIELGGLTAGSQYDRLEVNGAASLQGTLAVSLVDAGGGMFVPSTNNMFTIITATEGVGGAFDTYLLPGGYVWNILYGGSSVTAKVIGIGVNGDYNLNGVVDAADYVVWRKGLGTTYRQADLKIWLANFGKTSPGSGAASGLPESTVPEPAAAALLLTGAVVLQSMARRR